MFDPMDHYQRDIEAAFGYKPMTFDFANPEHYSYFFDHNVKICSIFFREICGTSIPEDGPSFRRGRSNPVDLAMGRATSPGCCSGSRDGSNRSMGWNQPLSSKTPGCSEIRH